MCVSVCVCLQASVDIVHVPKGNLLNCSVLQIQKYNAQKHKHHNDTNKDHPDSQRNKIRILTQRYKPRIHEPHNNVRNHKNTYELWMYECGCMSTNDSLDKKKKKDLREA